MDPTLIDWLLAGGIGPALVALPVNWTAAGISGVSRRWLNRLRHADGLARLLRSTSAGDLTRGQFTAVRRLLEDPRTWRLIGSGTVEDLAREIAACLSRNEYKAEEPLVAARAIARGLLEFAVFDLEPEIFQRVLLARIGRLETGEAAALDQAMLQLNADLVAWFAHQGQQDELRFRRITRQLGQVLDRLPPGPAGREEVTLYLAALVGWLNTDPWPRDPRLGGPLLAPAAIERKLVLASVSGSDQREFDADDLADQCTRLVILGGSGTGKTWLAKRIARRCAEHALEALSTSEAELSEVELPLFTTCSLLASAAGDIRSAAVSSALDQLGDMGGVRIRDSLQAFFTERNFSTLLVIDSLDEARDADARLRQADTLPWRIVLTSRPSSWRKQLSIKNDDPSHRSGSLQPLRYPEDVIPFITRWFSQDPLSGQRLAKQIASRPDLQQAATIPLILAFYCIIGSDQALPGTRWQTYAFVLRRMLTGLWRGNSGYELDSAFCSELLREWAWAAAIRDPVTGIGAWEDEVSTPHVQVSHANRAAIDHVATPLGLQHLDTGMTQRRFIHRSIREHLTAEFIATRMAANEAADELLNHIWYDSDWEYAAPAALAMHPQRDQILRRLMRQVVGSANIPEDLTDIDASGELYCFLAQVAQETSQSDWAVESARIITSARLTLASQGRITHSRAAPSWSSANSQIRQEVLHLLDGAIFPGQAVGLALTLARLNPEPGELAQARVRMLELLARTPNKSDADGLMRALTALDPKPGELTQARTLLLQLIDTTYAGNAWSRAEAVTRLELEPTELAHERTRILEVLETTDGYRAASEADALTKLRPEPGELSRARARMLDLLNNETSIDKALSLAGTLIKLNPPSDEYAQARTRTLELLASLTDVPSWYRLKTLTDLEMDASELAMARASMLELLSNEEDDYGLISFVGTFAQMSPTRDEVERLRQELLGRLTYATSEMDAALRGQFSRGPNLTDTKLRTNKYLPSVSRLDRERRLIRQVTESPQESQAAEPDRDHLKQKRERLLQLLSSWIGTQAAFEAAGALENLNPEPSELELARCLLARRASHKLRYIAEAIVKITAAEERDQAKQMLLGVLAHVTDAESGAELARKLVGLDPSQHELVQARKALLNVISQAVGADHMLKLVRELVGLNPGHDEAAEARHSLLLMLENPANTEHAYELAQALARLDPSGEQLEQCRQALLTAMTRVSAARQVHHLANVLAQLNPRPTQQEQIRYALVTLLNTGARDTAGWDLGRVLATLSPISSDLQEWRSWRHPPSRDLVAAVRRTSALSSWLDLLPKLTNLPTTIWR